MARRRSSVFGSLFGNIWMLVCIVATASCLVFAVQLLLRVPPLDAHVLRIRLALAVPAIFGAVAGLYGIVATVLLSVRNARLRRQHVRLRALRRRVDELESLHLSQRARLDELATLREVATVVNQETDFTIIAEKVLELIQPLLGPLEAAILLREEGKDEGLRPFAQYAEGKILTGRRTLALEMPRFSLAEFESHSLICRVHGRELHALVPLKVEDQIHGVLLLTFATDERLPEGQIAEFNRERRHVLLQVSYHISLAVKTKHLHTKAVVDGLTQLYTRSHFDAQLQAHIELARRTGEPFSMILLDIDHFKKINDTYGHDTGDVVLSRVAARIQSRLRKYDTAYRYGGEELAVLLPRADMGQAAVTAERLRSIIEEQRFRGAQNRLVRVTVSLGVAQFEPGDDPERLFRRADQRLYRAKEQGRNQVVAAA